MLERSGLCPAMTLELNRLINTNTWSLTLPLTAITALDDVQA